MTYKLSDVPLETVCVEHYLFDLGYSIERVSEIYDMDEESVRKIYDDRQKYEATIRRIK